MLLGFAAPQQVLYHPRFMINISITHLILIPGKASAAPTKLQQMHLSCTTTLQVRRFVMDTVTLGLVICERVLHDRPEACLAGRTGSNT